MPIYLSTLLVAICFVMGRITAAESGLAPGEHGVFSAHADIGPVRHAGSLSYDKIRQEYRITSSGANMWFAQDEFHFTWRQIQGDFIVRAHVQFIGEGVDPHRKLGWIARSSLDSDSAHVNATVHGDGLTSLQFRRSPSANTEESQSPVKAADVIQLERKGNTFTMAVARFGEPDNGRSIIYVLPVTGGTPRRVTPLGPSYLHGWSPDGQFLVYTAERDGQYDIYRIPASGGGEVQLTHTPTLDDGSEYSPDGAFIYFNSARTGRMQLWRMKPDGSDPEQLTHDEFNNWFPHLSPDGRWIVFLSYGPEVSAEDHPFYRQVYLRLMPAAGGSPRVIAYLYGGQGTINVPSWSPDSTRVAFVSNTGGIQPPLHGKTMRAKP